MGKRRKINKIELGCRVEDIDVLEVHEFEVEQLTPYQYRINGFLDFYPVNFKFHNIITNKRGQYDRNKVIDVAYKELEQVEKQGAIKCDCGGMLILKRNKANGNKFYGCTNYPQCTITQKQF